MAAPAGFADALNRKYDILQQEATDRGSLEQAQAASVAASTPFENALKAAQARQAGETAKTISPLAQASISATNAGIGETYARTGLYGAQTGLTGAQTQDVTADLGNIGPGGSRYYLDQLRRMGTTYAPGGGSPAAPAAGSTGGQVGVAQPQSSVLSSPTASPGTPPPPKPAGNSGIIPLTTSGGSYDEFGNYVQALSRGATSVKPIKGKIPIAAPGALAGGLPGFGGAMAAAKGASKVPGKGSGTVDKVPAMLAPGEAVVNKAGVKHIPGGRAAIAKANAKGNQEVDAKGAKPAAKMKPKAGPPPRAVPHFAAGTDNVPSGPTPPRPGDTTSTGTWGPPPPAPTTGGSLRDQLGMGVPRRISY